MSGIAGVVALDGGAVDVAVAERMSAKLAARGPDDDGFWFAPSVALAHRALHMTGARRERQPIAWRENGLVVTLDGRIDDPDAGLRATAIDGRLLDDSDAQVVLAAYDRWGHGCAAKLLGDFAFAVWDATKQTLFCARDIAGTRPFYYQIDGRVLRFASERGMLQVQAGFQRRPVVEAGSAIPECPDAPGAGSRAGIDRPPILSER